MKKKKTPAWAWTEADYASAGTVQAKFRLTIGAYAELTRRADIAKVSRTALLESWLTQPIQRKKSK